MDQLRRSLLTAIACSPLLARAQGSGEYTTLRKELPLETKGKIEVVEFFWYGCIHCYRLEALLDAWVPKLRPDTVFRRIPAVFNARWGHDAAIYYSFEVLGVLEKVHRGFFDAIHLNRLKTDSAPALGAWLSANGLEPKKFDEVMKSFGVQSKVRRAAQITAAAAIDGTPALAVQGRYTISAEQGGTHAGMLAIADRLIGMVRKNLAAAR
ncbi:MAG: thiol:disulfide interchange protein DsbA/DsbL [Pseudomonadota bacterium]